MGNENINVREMVKFASDVLSNRESISLKANDSLTYSQLVQVGIKEKTCEYINSVIAANIVRKWV